MKKNIIGVLVILTIAIFILKITNQQTTQSPTVQNEPSSSQQEIIQEEETSSSTTTTTDSATYSLAEIAQHATASDCWMAIDGDVLDVTSYIASGEHVPEIVDGCGIDATDLFNSERHHNGPKAQNLLSQFTIGTLE